MFVKRLIYDEWYKNNDIGNQIESPSWECAEDIIKSLDGKIRTQVILSDEDDEAFICIGGGNGSLYNVFITLDDNESFYNLIDTSKSKKNKIQLVTGGQLGEFKEYMCISIDKALLAAKTFFQSGTVEESLQWEYKG